MLDLHVAPFLLQVLGHQPAMAMLGRGLAAQQAAPRHQILIDRFLDATHGHEGQERLFINRPVAVVLLVGIENVLRGRQFRQVDVIEIADLAKKELQIVLLGEAGKLRNVVQPHVDQAQEAGLLERVKNCSASSW